MARALLLAAFWIGLFPGARATAAPPAIDPARLEALVDGAVGLALQQEGIAGVSVAVVDGSGVLLAKGYGLAAPDRPADDATLFRVGSISKTPVWIALMQLVEQGKLSLDDPVNDRLPAALRIPDEGFAEPIRVRHLMTHTAGFEDSLLGSLFVDDPVRLQPMSEYLASHRVHRVRPPGQLAAYSNYGAALAGAIVAEVSGLAWEDYAEQRILRPLGMTSATYREPYPADLAKARGLPAPMPDDVAARLSAGWLVESGLAKPQTTEFVEQLAPAGALSASARDMAAYMRALLDPARMEQAGVLHEKTALALREPLFANSPVLGPLRHGFLDYRLPGGPLAFGHDGGLMYQHARMVISPDLGVGIFLGINSSAGATLHENLPVLVVREFFGGDGPKGVYGSDAAAEARAHAGTWLGLRRPYFRTERAFMGLVGALRIQATDAGDLLVPSFPGQILRRFVPLGGGRYASENGVTEVAFETRDGRELLVESFGIMPMERLGFFQQPIVSLGLLAAAHLVVLAGLAGIAVRWWRGRAGSRALDALTIVWAIALALFWIGLAPLAGGGAAAAVYRYPGAVLPVACWALALAAGVTLLGVAALPRAARTAERPRRFWLARGGSLAVLLLASLALWRAGLLGYSGW